MAIKSVKLVFDLKCQRSYNHKVRQVRYVSKRNTCPRQLNTVKPALKGTSI